MEDAETGEQIEINTADRSTRTRFAELAEAQSADLNRTLRRNNIDTISLRTGRRLSPGPALIFQTTRAPPGRAMNLLAYATFLAQEFHDISPPVDYSLLPTWVIFLAAFVTLAFLGLLVWLFIRWKRRPKPEQTPRARALELLQRARAEIDTSDALSIQHPRLGHSASLCRRAVSTAGHASDFGRVSRRAREGVALFGG